MMSHHRSKLPDDAGQARGDLAEGADFDGAQKFGEDIALRTRGVLESLQRVWCALCIFPFESGEALDLGALFFRRRTRERHMRHLCFARVAVEADDRALAGVDLVFVAVRGFLDLAALVALFH